MEGTSRAAQRKDEYSSSSEQINGKQGKLKLVNSEEKWHIPWIRRTNVKSGISCIRAGRKSLTIHRRLWTAQWRSHCLCWKAYLSWGLNRVFIIKIRLLWKSWCWIFEEDKSRISIENLPTIWINCQHLTITIGF